MKLFLITIPLFYFNVCFGSSFDPSVVKKIDQLVEQGLAKNDQKPNPEITDTSFLKRIYLSMVGRIPTLQEYKNFITHKSSKRRSELIEELLHSSGYTSHQHNQWLDTLRAVSYMQKGSGVNYLQWIKHAIHTNMPYDQFVYELVTAEGQMYQPGNGKVGYYYRDFRMPLDNLSNTMALFNGSSMACAQCHDHPKNDFSQMDFLKLAAYTNGMKISVRTGDHDYAKKLTNQIGMNKFAPNFAYERFFFVFDGAYSGGTGKYTVPEEYLYDDAQPGDIVKAGVPFGKAPQLSYKPADKQLPFQMFGSKNDKVDINSRTAFAKWLTSKDNPMFTKTIVNRMWHRVMGATLCGRLLDMKLVSKGKNPELTYYLIDLMKNIDYDLRLFMQYLYNTKTFQRKMIENQPDDSYIFQGPVMQRLTSEQIHDSIYALKSESPDKKVYTGKLTPNAAKMVMIEHFPEEIVKAYPTQGTNGNNKKGKKDLAMMASSKKGQMQSTMSEGSMMMSTGGKGDAAKKFQDNFDRIAREFVTAAEGFDYTTFRATKTLENRASEMYSPMKPGTFLHLFGQSQRTTPDDTNREANTLQALKLMNNEPLLRFEGSTNLGKHLKQSKSHEETIKVLFRSILVREPSSSEMDYFKKYLSESKVSRGPYTPIQDLIWVLINTNEFKLTI